MIAKPAGKSTGASTSAGKEPYSVFVLGAGFSAAAGLPTANELWREVRRRAEAIGGRADKFKDDLHYFIAFKKHSQGIVVTPDDVNFEEFLGFLDIEFHLGLRGSGTWSSDGNETQVVVKTLIGQVLAERMPSAVPSLYIEFAKKLQPGDTVLTFNYDLLLEKALESAGKPFRLFPTKYQSGGTVADDNYEEVVILKLHGSLDWFDKSRYSDALDNFRRAGAAGSPSDPIFDPAERVELVPLLYGPRPWQEPLTNVFRVVDFKRVYQKPIMFMATPLIIPPSTTKVLWFEKLKSFWWGMQHYGVLNFRMVIIGFSLAPHDEYALQVVYSLVRNYQTQHWGKEIFGRRKLPLRLVDLRKTTDDQNEFKQRYSFVDWSRANVHFDGFNMKVVEDL